MKNEELVKKLREECKGNNWVVITENGDIWGSDASFEALKMGGGKIAIFNAYDLEDELSSNYKKGGILDHLSYDDYDTVENFLNRFRKDYDLWK